MIQLVPKIQLGFRSLPLLAILTLTVLLEVFLAAIQGISFLVAAHQKGPLEDPILNFVLPLKGFLPSLSLPSPLACVFYIPKG